MTTVPTHNQPEYSVSEISSALKRVVEDTFGYVRVRGEISGFKRAASGHLYMDLKDDKAVLNGVCWKGVATRIPFKPEDGLEVIVTGKISTYPGRSNYQIIIDQMEMAGEGALMALLEKRKKQLAAEGLFAPERKQPLPYLPSRIGVVTSPTGAVIRDILHRLEERFPVHVQLWPVRVQGDGAAEEIAHAIAAFNRMASPPDLLIVARGGGSLEDLWAFNEEVVVRAAAASTIPLISAVGHETDTTLIDFVSDKRAPTPTAAAEMAVPVRSELIAWLMETHSRLFAAVSRNIRQRAERVEGLARGLPKPLQLLSHQQQRLDDWAERLKASLPIYMEKKQAALAQIHLSPRLLAGQIETLTTRLTNIMDTAGRIVSHRLSQSEDRLSATARMLESLDYRNVMKRGYALVKQRDGHLVTSCQMASRADRLTLQFHDGETDVTPAKAKKPVQETLF